MPLKVLIQFSLTLWVNSIKTLTGKKKVLAPWGGEQLKGRFPKCLPEFSSLLNACVPFKGLPA